MSDEWVLKAQSWLVRVAPSMSDRNPGHLAAVKLALEAADPKAGSGLDPRLSTAGVIGIYRRRGGDHVVARKPRS